MRKEKDTRRVNEQAAGHFDRYDIVSDSDLKAATAKQETFFGAATVSATIGKNNEKEVNHPNG
ncbi:MAG: hypothetical protein K9N21_02335 [Deltaproteobacteria bacterium]|nr:hypothetical protein [Deltaproteobacteria bacterium]